MVSTVSSSAQRKCVQVCVGRYVVGEEKGSSGGGVVGSNVVVKFCHQHMQNVHGKCLPRNAGGVCRVGNA